MALEGVMSWCEVAERTGLPKRQVEAALRNMRKLGLVATTGFTHRCKWLKVPGAVYHGDGRGKQPRSRANISWVTKRNGRTPPRLTWATLLNAESV